MLFSPATIDRDSVQVATACVHAALQPTLLESRAFMLSLQRSLPSAAKLTVGSTRRILALLRRRISSGSMCCLNSSSSSASSSAAALSPASAFVLRACHKQQNVVGTCREQHDCHCFNEIPMGGYFCTGRTASNMIVAGCSAAVSPPASDLFLDACHKHRKGLRNMYTSRAADPRQIMSLYSLLFCECCHWQDCSSQLVAAACSKLHAIGSVNSSAAALAPVVILTTPQVTGSRLCLPG